jgi:hypothetical protein
MNLERKSRQFKSFLEDTHNKINLKYDHDLPRVTQLYGEKREIAKTSLDILNKYKKKFSDVRGTDIESIFAEANDAERFGASSYKKHMRPNMIREFENSYKTLTTILNIDVFFGLQQLPVIQNNGFVKYLGEKKEKKVVEEEIKEEVKKERIILPPVPKSNDAWTDEPFVSPLLYTIKAYFPMTKETIYF